ncbi:cation:dicarboxylate symporter family transporter [Streptomyces sp. NPDC007917]|uniref:cation:dicarboxylate symporter family transporter n=1 Tax=Streptomyces sp. NPDC007917 TaxID=3364793 RepID=UPI0036E97F14
MNLFKLCRYLKEELLIILATCSSEAVLPRMVGKMEHLGASRPVVGLTLPTGYSFNLDGTAIYLTMSSLFLAQALDIHMSLGEQLVMLGIMMLTSKGAAGVPVLDGKDVSPLTATGEQQRADALSAGVVAPAAAG